MKPLDPQDLRYTCRRAQYALAALTGADILITGARGFVGSWMKDTAYTAGLNTTNHLGRSDGDIRELTIPRGTTHVIHCASAASASENAAHQGEVCDMIVAGTAHVARECRRGGARLLHLSSGSVYVPNVQGTYHETDPLRTNIVTRDDAVPHAKRVAEDLAIETHPDTVIARGFAMLGPRLPPQFAASEFVAAALDPRYITVAGSGATVRSYLYAADVAAHLWHLLAFGEPGQAYNVGSDSPTTVGTLACHVAAASGLDVDTSIRWGTTSHDAPPFVPNTQKFRDLVGAGWAPPLTPLESIARWIHWERA